MAAGYLARNVHKYGAETHSIHVALTICFDIDFKVERLKHSLCTSFYRKKCTFM